MNATILSEKKKHFPVLLNEIISIITPQYGGTFIDCTFGQGGYSKKILEYPNTKVLSLDRDKYLLGDLYITLMNKMGVKVNSFSNASSSLNDVFV